MLVDGRNTADRKAVALMDIRHRQSASHNSGKHGDVGRLFQGLILANRFKKALAGIDDRIRQHAGLVRFRNEPAVIVNLFQVHTRRQRRPESPNHPESDGSRIDDTSRP